MQKRQYVNALKLIYIFKRKNRKRGELSRVNKAYFRVLRKYGHKGWVELARNQKQNICN